jgi:carbon storage regulator CsrA
MALVLTRRPGEAVLLRREGRQVRVYVVSVEANVVRLAFDAPREIEILREELVPTRLDWTPALWIAPAVRQAVRHLVTILWHRLR